MKNPPSRFLNDIKNVLKEIQKRATRKSGKEKKEPLQLTLLALNVISDKIVMYKLEMKYTYLYLRDILRDIEWAKILEQTEEGKRLLEMLFELQERYEQAKKYLDIDAVSKRGKQFFDNITTQ